LTKNAKNDEKMKKMTKKCETFRGSRGPQFCLRSRWDILEIFLKIEKVTIELKNAKNDQKMKKMTKK
jgi:hypothetical protein